MVRARPWDADRPKQRPAVTPVAELDAIQALDDVYGFGAVGGEVEVVRERDRDRALRPARLDVEHGQAAGTLVVHVQLAHVPGGRDVVRDDADAVVVDNRERARVDDVDRAGHAVRDVDAWGELAQRAGDDPGQRVGVHVERGLGQGRRLYIRGRQEPRRQVVHRPRRAGVDRRRGPHNREHHGGRAYDGKDEHSRQEHAEHARADGTGQRPEARFTRPEDLQVSASARRPIFRHRDA